MPKPRVHLTRFHGVFAPNSKYRALVTPAKRGKGKKGNAAQQQQDQTPAERRASMTWAQRLKRVFNIDIETCSECGGAVKIIACIEDPVVIAKILTHLEGLYRHLAVPLISVASRLHHLRGYCLAAPPKTDLFEENHHSNARLH